MEFDHFGGSSFIDSSGISLRERADLYVVNMGTLSADCYRNVILQPKVRTFASAIGDSFIFVQYNTRVDIAGSYMYYRTL